MIYREGDGSSSSSRLCRRLAVPEPTLRFTLSSSGSTTNSNLFPCWLLYIEYRIGTSLSGSCNREVRRDGPSRAKHSSEY